MTTAPTILRGEVRRFSHGPLSEAEERAQRFRSVFADAADPMLILDADRRIVDANRAAAALFGLSSGSLDASPARTLDDLVVDDEGEVAAGWREFLALGEAKREHRVIVADGGQQLVECSYRAANQADRHLCIARDITDRRLIEERLVESEKVESVGRWPAASPMTSIISSQRLSDTPSCSRAIRR